MHVRGGERQDSSGFEQRNDGAAADYADVRGNRNASANSVTEEKVLSSVIEESGGSGMLRTVDPMMIDDDIFADDGFVTVEATHAQEESTLGNPPEPPPPSDGSVGQAAKSQSLSDGGRGAYVPNVMEDEDEDEEAASLLVAPSVSSSSTLSSVQSSSPRAEDIARNLDERIEEEDEVLLTMEERGQTDFLREALPKCNRPAATEPTLRTLDLPGSAKPPRSLPLQRLRIVHDQAPEQGALGGNRSSYPCQRQFPTI